MPFFVSDFGPDPLHEDEPDAGVRPASPNRHAGRCRSHLTSGSLSQRLPHPRAGFGDVEVYPTILEKAAILVARLARNHPLPDGNKRTAFFLMGVFLERNGSQLSSSPSASNT